jgi:hypothetical protein
MRSFVLFLACACGTGDKGGSGGAGSGAGNITVEDGVEVVHHAPAATCAKAAPPGRPYAVCFTSMDDCSAAGKRTGEPMECSFDKVTAYACFAFETRTSHEGGVLCMPSYGECEGTRKLFQTDPEVGKLQACRIMRAD